MARRKSEKDHDHLIFVWRIAHPNESKSAKIVASLIVIGIIP
jgi:hypothetical protein